MSCPNCDSHTLRSPTSAGAGECQPGPRGAQGPTGAAGAAGENGLHAYTLTTADFTMPDVGASVFVEVENGEWVGSGQIIYVAGAGYFSASNPTATTVTLSNLGYGPNVLPGNVIASGAIVSPGGPKGANAPDDTRGYIMLRRELSSGTNGGTFTAGAWEPRLLNTTVNDTANQVLALNTGTGIFQIKAGKYKVRCEAPAFDVNRHRTRLRNVTSGGSIYGTSEFTGDNGQSNSLAQGIVEILVDTEFILESRCSVTKASTGFGIAANFDQPECFEFVEFTEIP